MAGSPPVRASTMMLSERLEQYRLCIKNMDACQSALYSLGFLSEQTFERQQKFLIEERVRVERALHAFGHFVNGSTPAAASGIPSLDAARKIMGEMSDKKKPETAEPRKGTERATSPADGKKK